MSDRLHDTLSSLRTDVDHMPLADSSAVRARGNQRTRRQAVGTSLAVVALVAGAVGIGGALTGTNKANDLPADPTPTGSVSPTPDPTVETRPEIGTELLLEPADLPPVPNQTFAVGQTFDPATSADAKEQFLTVCGSPPSGAQTPDLALLRTFPSDLDAFMWQWVAQYPTTGDAETAFGALTNACSAEPGQTVTPLSLPAEASGIRASKFSAEPNSEYNGGITGVVRQGDVVLVVGLRGMLRDGDVDLDAFDAAVVRAAERVATR
jgi:hypothetical protein